MSNDEIIELAIQGHASTRDAIRWAINQEREACAKECEHTALRMGSEWMAQHCAEAIRARGQT